jgi:hypothetical protein
MATQTEQTYIHSGAGGWGLVSGWDSEDLSGHGGHPITIRLLNPPPRAFLPTDPDKHAELTGRLNLPVELITEKVKLLDEVSPMLRRRDCRLGGRPEITAMQACVIFEAALSVQANGVGAGPEMMVSLVITVAEFDDEKAVLDEIAETVFEKGILEREPCRIKFVPTGQIYECLCTSSCPVGILLWDASGAFFVVDPPFLSPRTILQR